MIGVSPTRPGLFAVIPPVEVAAAMLPLVSMATAPTVSHPGHLDCGTSSLQSLEEKKHDQINYEMKTRYRNYTSFKYHLKM